VSDLIFGAAHLEIGALIATFTRDAAVEFLCVCQVIANDQGGSIHGPAAKKPTRKKSSKPELKRTKRIVRLCAAARQKRASGE